MLLGQRLVRPGEVVGMKCREMAAMKLSTFFEKALVSRVNRRMPIRMVRFCRST